MDKKTIVNGTKISRDLTRDAIDPEQESDESAQKQEAPASQGEELLSQMASLLEAQRSNREKAEAAIRQLIDVDDVEQKNEIRRLVNAFFNATKQLREKSMEFDNNSMGLPSGMITSKKELMNNCAENVLLMGKIEKVLGTIGIHLSLADSVPMENDSSFSSGAKPIPEKPIQSNVTHLYRREIMARKEEQEILSANHSLQSEPSPESVSQSKFEAKFFELLDQVKMDRKSCTVSSNDNINAGSRTIIIQNKDGKLLPNNNLEVVNGAVKASASLVKSLTRQELATMMVLTFIANDSIAPVSIQSSDPLLKAALSLELKKFGIAESKPELDELNDRSRSMSR